MRCLYKDCNKNPDCSCLCDFHLKLLCLDHLEIHLKDNPSCIHDLDSITNAPFFQKESTHDIKRKLGILTSHKSTLLLNTSRAISEIVTKTKTKLLYYEHLKGKYLKQLGEISMFNNEIDANLSHLKANISILSNGIAYSTAEEFDSFAYYHQHLNTIQMVSIKNLKSIQRELYFPTNYGNGLKSLSVCKLPDEKLFFLSFSLVHQNIAYDSGAAFILDDSNNCNVINSGTSSASAGLVYGDGCIYKVGAYDRAFRHKNVCERYDLAKGKGIKLSQMPSAGYWHTCAAFKNKILYSGNKIDVFLYDPFTDSHSVLLHFNQINNILDNKIVFVNNQRAYIAITDGEIYESCIDDPYHWSIFMVSSGIISKCLLSYPIIRKDTLYLLTDFDSIYKLDLNKKTIQIKKVIAA